MVSSPPDVRVHRKKVFQFYVAKFGLKQVAVRDLVITIYNSFAMVASLLTLPERTLHKSFNLNLECFSLQINYSHTIP